ncbi:MAG TPA: SMP-30/gluconolactonase/LRE family protein [Herpetosiphonaceae bacterium]
MRMRSVIGSLSLFLAVVGTMSSGAVSFAQPSTRGVHQRNTAVRYTFPAGDVVYPEGIAFHGGNKDFFVGSTNGGAVYRGNARRGNRHLDLFLPAGSDGRTDVRGMKVNPQGQLFLAGGATGTMWMYDAVTGRFLSSFRTGAEGSFINDVAIAPDGAAYFTDSNIPQLYRIKADEQGVYRFEVWRDLRDTVIQYAQGFNLNGIVVTPDGKYLIVVQSNTGKLFRITTDTRDVTELTLTGGDRMTAGDGLLLDGQTLHVVRNSLNLIVQLRLTPDFGNGQQIGSFTDRSFAFTTTVAKADDRLLVVNSQFNRRTTNNPELPFTISSVPVP